MHEISAPYKHKQNGLAERSIQTVSQRAMCQLFGADMSQGFWLYAVENAVYLINRCLTTALDNKMPYEAWTGEWLNIKHLCTFGETGYVHVPPEMQKKWMRKSCLCRLLGYVPRSRNYKMWDPNQHTVIMSPNVDFDESSVHRAADSKWDLEDLSNVLNVREEVCTAGPTNPGAEVGDQVVDGDGSEWESDEEILWPRATVDEGVSNGPEPEAPLALQEPNAPICHRRCSEAESLADTARPPPTNERRRLRAAANAAMELVVANKSVNGNCASVGVMEIEGKVVEHARKHAYYEALLATENTLLHNKPTSVKEVQDRPDWLKWERAMHEELNSLK